MIRVKAVPLSRTRNRGRARTSWRSLGCLGFSLAAWFGCNSSDPAAPDPNGQSGAIPTASPGGSGAGGSGAGGRAVVGMAGSVGKGGTNQGGMSSAGTETGGAAGLGGPVGGASAGGANSSNGGAGGAFGNPIQGIAPARKLASGRTFQSLEGPIWMSDLQRVLFSDVVDGNVSASQIYSYDPVAESFGTFAYPDGPITTNGLGVDSMGRLIACERTNGDLARIDGSSRTVIASGFANTPLGAPNDVVVSSRNDIYFSDTIWGRTGPHAADGIPIGVYRLGSAGSLSFQSTPDLPNGVVLSPDERTLYIASDGTGPRGNAIWKLLLDEQGTMTGAVQDFISAANVPGGDFKTPDGLCIDQAGDIYAVNNSALVRGIQVFTAAGSYLGKIPVDANGTPSNCTFGGGDHRTLFITVGTELWSVRINVPGMP